MIRRKAALAEKRPLHRTIGLIFRVGGHPPVLIFAFLKGLPGEIDVPGHYQKAGEIDFTTRCLAFVFGESGALLARARLWSVALTRWCEKISCTVAIAAGAQESTGRAFADQAILFCRPAIGAKAGIRIRRALNFGRDPPLADLAKAVLDLVAAPPVAITTTGSEAR